ncbi:hypothetical protein HYFRA_00007656 [Hymenoscyphus fraxineus]|uniref:Zn(2)-C6 fungal-type domain-containing protein n=1 Tax=Hymenoscyphus fraxineus TaxID=746836 RepID=A0A9N9PN07_9HELO|nr:hypothetical protein HYFRA_00007656 [Hymenoscyphus fraxineus]
MGNDFRSQKGCWTCRVRKRKCDEKFPICSTCRALKIECHGYGAQPEWMDRGAKQRAQALKIKQMVAEVRSQRRKNQNLSENMLSRKCSREHSHSRDSSISSISVATPTNLESTFWEHDHYFPLPTTTSSHSDDSGYFASLNEGETWDLLATCTTFTKQAALLDGKSQADDFTLDDALISQHNIHFPTNGIVESDMTALGRTSECGRSEQVSIEIAPAVCSKSRLAIENFEEATLLAYYFEKVFSWQFPFNRSHLIAFNHGHVMWLISKSQPLYHATLALSSTYKAIQENKISLERTPQYGLAIKEFQNELKDPKSYDEVSLLLCIVMLLHSGLLYESGYSDWYFHLQVGLSIVTSWIDYQDQNLVSHHACRIENEYGNDANTIAPVKIFLIGCIIRFDILSSITRDSAPILSHRYQQIFQESSYGMQLENSLQCRSWLLSTLLDIFLLRNWKKRTEACGLLSLRELISKAFPIKQTLERGIDLNMKELLDDKNDPESVYSDPKNDSRQRDHELLVVTHIFACSVSIFLEVVLSGALPKLPEIQHEVSRAIGSYAYIDDPALLDLLHWPICIAGSVAEPDQFDFFRGLLSSPNVIRRGAFRRSLERLEECWGTSLYSNHTDTTIDITKLSRFMAWDILIV